MLKSETQTIRFTLPMHGIDRACERAYQDAVYKFGIDDCGHCKDSENFPRSSSSLHVQFVTVVESRGMGGGSITYEFIAWMECADEDD